MRPLRLTLTAFGPYAGTEVVDFDALTELGLFVVAGNNGSGKTTIFDALHYGLFGTLPGRRASYTGLKSDHADQSAECKVVLDFAAHGKHWRVERTPKQKRPKRRGDGFTEVDRRATLYRLEHGDRGPATAVANKIGEVDEQCRQLVGLSGKQFERVALLPQGEFSRVLRESGTERRELLRTLFSSEIFGDATSWLTDQAAAATAQDQAVLDRLDHQQTVLAEELRVLVNQPVGTSAAELATVISDCRRVQLADLTAKSEALKATAAQTTQAHQAARNMAQRIERRAQVQRDFAHHQAMQTQHADSLARLAQARAAVPIVSRARALADYQEQHSATHDRVAELRARLTQVMTTAGLEPLTFDSEASLGRADAAFADLSARLSDHGRATKRVNDLDALTKRSQGDLRRLANETTSLQNQNDVAQAQLRQAVGELKQLTATPSSDQCVQQVQLATAQLERRRELAAIEDSHQQLVRRATELDAAIEHLQGRYEDAQNASVQHAKLAVKAATALTAFEESTRRRAAAQQYEHASARLVQARTQMEQATRQADHLWDAFITGTAARLAETLTAEDPCPVCGSEEHPAPALHETDGRLVTDSDVSAARLHSDSVQTSLRQIEAQIEALRTTDVDIATLSLTELSAEISTTKAMALGARQVADDAQHSAAQLDQIVRELATHREARVGLDAELRAHDQRRSRLEGALGDIANEPLHVLNHRLDEANQARLRADQAASRRSELDTQITDVEQDIETIGLGRISVESRRTSTSDQLSERQEQLASARRDLANLENALAIRLNEPTEIHDFEHRALAARQGRELLAELTTATARDHDARDAYRQAQSNLDDALAATAFTSVETAVGAAMEPHEISQLESQTTSFAATGERLQGQLHELADLPPTSPDIAALTAAAEQASQAYTHANRSVISLTTSLDRVDRELHELIAERNERQSNDLATRRLERVAALVKGDNARNTSLENWVLAAHLRDVVELANIRLARSTHQRFQLCVLDDGQNKRGKWGLDLGVEDTVTGTRRPTAGLSGGELFQASLALALGLADAVMNQSAGVRVDALFIDEGFGSLDEVSVERAIDLLDELRDRGAMVGVITHVPALLDALPLGVSVIDAPSGQGSTIRQSRLVA